MKFLDNFKLNWQVTLKVGAVRVLINALILIFIVVIFPNISAPNYKFGDFLILGLLFGLLNAFLKPFIQLITFPLLFVSYGLVIIAVNTLLLLLLEWLSTWLFGMKLISIDTLVAAIIGGTVAGLLTSVLEYIFGVTPPIVDDQAVVDGGAS